MKTSRSSPTQIQDKTSSLKIKKAKQPYNAKRTPSFKARKVATPGTFIDTSEEVTMTRATKLLTKMLKKAMTMKQNLEI